jgi:hypothetical protein
MANTVVRCPYCAAGDEFLPMVSHPIERRFICEKCGHTVCFCEKCIEVYRESARRSSTRAARFQPEVVAAKAKKKGRKPK